MQRMFQIESPGKSPVQFKQSRQLLGFFGICGRHGNSLPFISTYLYLQAMKIQICHIQIKQIISPENRCLKNPEMNHYRSGAKEFAESRRGPNPKGMGQNAAVMDCLPHPFAGNRMETRTLVTTTLLFPASRVFRRGKPWISIRKGFGRHYGNWLYGNLS